MTDDFLSDEEKALFRAQMHSVKPLNKKAKRISASLPPTQAQKKNHEPSATPEPIEKNYYLSDVIIDPVFSETLLSYSHPSLANQRFKALKKGQIPWEARLDLHGLKSEKAREILCQSIDHQVKNSKRCLLIIHGKGGYLNAPPVIKNLINRWLPQLDDVLAFHSALPKDGGNGAVYVLLKRQR